MFDYPPEQEVKTEEAPEKVKTAVLSTTAQDKRRKLVKARQRRRESMDVDQTPTTPKIPASDEDKMDVEEDSRTAEKDHEAKEDTPSAEASKKKVEKEKVGYEMENMSRVLPGQLKYISFFEERYVPIKKPTGGVILLTDTTPSESKTLLELKVKKAAPAPGAAGPSGDSAPAGVQTASSAAPASDNLVDEGEDDAAFPGEFEYHSDGGDGDED